MSSNREGEDIVAQKFANNRVPSSNPSNVLACGYLVLQLEINLCKKVEIRSNNTVTRTKTLKSVTMK